MGQGILFVNHHYIRDVSECQYPGIHPLSIDNFERNLEIIAQHYDFASIQDVENYLDGKELRGKICITFDDGLKEHYTAALNVLQRRNIKGVFFVCSRPAVEGKALCVHKMHWLRATTNPDAFLVGFLKNLPLNWRDSDLWESYIDKANKIYIYDIPKIAVLKFMIGFVLPNDLVDEIGSFMLKERGVDEAIFCKDLYLSDAEVEQLSKLGHEVGAHGHTHFPVTRLSQKDLDYEIEINKEYLHSCTGRTTKWYSYPYGRNWALPDDPQGFAQKYSFPFCLTLENGWVSQGSKPFCLPRINCNELKEFL